MAIIRNAFNDIINHEKFRVNDKFEDIDNGGIIWRYKVERVSPTIDMQRDEYSYFVSICYDEFSEFGEPFTMKTYSVMGHSELSNERFIKKVNYWSDHPNRYGVQTHRGRRRTDF